MFSNRNSLKRLVRRLGLAGLAAGAIGLAGQQALGVDYDWQGPGAANRSGNWTLAANWLGAGAPPDAVDDTASILLAWDIPYTVTMNTSPTIGFLTLDQAQATLFMSGRTLTLVDGADLLAGKMTMSSSTLKSSVIGAGTLVHNVETTITGGGNFDFGTFTNGGKITVQGAGSGSATLNSSGGFTNSGQIELTSSGSSQSSLNIAGAGVLLNSSTGVLSALFGTSTGHTRNLGAHLTMQGVVNVEAGTTLNLDKSEGLFINENAFNIGSGALDSQNGGTRVYTQQAGTLDNQGTFNVVNFNGGQITGNAVTINSSTLNIGPGSMGQGSFTALSASEISGDVAAAQTIRVLGNSSFSSTLTAASGFVNNGLIRLDSSASTTAVLNVTAGTLTNSATGTLEFLFGSSTGHTRSLGANLDSLGLVTVEAGTTLNLTKGSGSYTNRGQFNIGAGAIVNAGSSQIFTQEAGTLDNQGSLNIVGGNTFNFNGGQITGNPVTINAGSLNIGPGSMGAGGFTTVSATSYSGDLASGQSLRILGNSSFTATLTAANGFTNQGLIQLDSTASTNATLVVTNGTLVNGIGGTLEFLFGSSTSHTRNLTASLDNQGLTRVQAGTTVNLNKSGGAYVNRNVFNIETGASLIMSGLSQVFTQEAGTLDNQGQFLVSGGTLTFNGGQFTGQPVSLTSSTLNIGPGSLGAGNFIITSGSAISGDLASAQTVRIQGNPSGSATLTAAASFANHGTILLDSTSSTNATLTLLDGMITNETGGVIDLLKGASTSRTRTLNAALDNKGLFHLEADVVGAMPRGDSSHVNTGQINLEAGSSLTIGGAGTSLNQLSGQINNQGSLLFNATTLRLFGGTLTGNPVQVSLGTLELPDGAAATGSVLMTGTSNNLIGDINSGLTVTLLATPSGNSNVTSADSVTNHGVVNMDSTSSTTPTLTINADEFYNAPDGLLRLMTGSSTGRQRILNGHFANDGQVIIENLADFRLSKLNGIHKNNASIMIAGGILNLSGSASVLTNQPGGVISGTGSIQATIGALINNGTIAPGNSPGVLTINGGFTHAASGILEIEIAGLTPGTEYDQLAITGAGATNLSGRLFVELDGGFTPQPTDTFQVLTNVGARIGEFSNVTCDRLPVIGGTFQVIYNPGNVTLTDFQTNPGLAADFNGDGAVDDLDLDLIGAALNGGPSSPMFDLNQDSLVTRADVDVIIFDILGTFYGDANLNCSVTIGDLTILAEHFNGPGGWAFGDFTGNGVVSIGDLTVLAENFGAGEPLIGASLSAGPTAIPLPPAALGGLALLGGMALRRRGARAQA